jgi:hypothetical protein
MKKIEAFTLGCGDRFGREGVAQLQAFVQARQEGIDVCPVWNKSNREHDLIGSEPLAVRLEADAAVQELDWKHAYYVDADHIGLKTVDRFLEPSDFFTLDVADFIGKSAATGDVDAFAARWQQYRGRVEIPGLEQPLEITEAIMRAAADKFLFGMQAAGEIYRHIEERRTAPFVTEVSIDETDAPQTPVELFLILLMLAQEGVPVQTIAPKFTGRFNKGVDYVGDLGAFEREFDADLAIIRFAIDQLGFAPSLKMSVHSGSDKFSIYPIIRKLIQKHGTGLHVKTAGTNWLEELIGLAEAGGSGLRVAKDVYLKALSHYDDLVAPYRQVIDITRAKLPSPESMEGWSSDQFTSALRHDPSDPLYNPNFRQFLHVSFKIAAKMGPVYTDAIAEHAAVIGRNVTFNLLERHLRPIFGSAP